MIGELKSQFDTSQKDFKETVWFHGPGAFAPGNGYVATRLRDLAQRSPRRIIPALVHRVIADRMPAFEQVVLFGAACSLAAGRKMNMDMRSALCPGVRHADVPLQSLL